MSDLYDYIDGEPVISDKGVSVLMGVPIEQIRALAMFRGRGAVNLPDEWVKAGVRRRKEYEAATGRTDMLGALEYWSQMEDR